MDDAALLYLEADDEVTTVVRRVRASSEPRVVVVAPGRSRATSSVVALRLLARIGAEEGRELAVVGDSLTRSLAGEAGLAAYVTIDDARRAEPVLLPSATVTIEPATTTIQPRTYTILLQGPAEGAERRTSMADQTATAVATGTYPIRVQATGTVVFFNFNTSAVEVPAGTLVAANEQAFATVTPIVVPEGKLTPQGTIQAGEASAPVMASAPGQAGNVAAQAIDTVLSEGIRNRLRGFANNAQPLVGNPNPTSGGDERTGPEFTQADVDAAVEGLRAALVAEVETALGEVDLRVPVGVPAEPAFEGVDDLVGTRDQPAVEIRGTLAYDTWLVDPEQLERAAAERIGADREAVPDGYRLVDAGTTVEVTGTAGTPEGAEISVAAGGRAVAEVRPEEVLDRIRGLTPDEGEVALADLGRARIDLWPDWAQTVTELHWRIGVVIEAPTDVGEAQPSDSPTP
ncbi:MAG: baseplate J/gp47 family protein [Chloroflexi bacterium]|nr:baseplate J/gp47 family protein [Chloroflexota bacterium]